MPRQPVKRQHADPPVDRIEGTARRSLQQPFAHGADPAKRLRVKKHRQFIVRIRGVARATGTDANAMQLSRAGSFTCASALDYGFGGAASIFARLRRRRAASACFFRRFTLGFM